MKKKYFFSMLFVTSAIVLSGCKFLDAGAFRVTGINSLSEDEKKKDVFYTVSFDTKGGLPIESRQVQHNHLVHVETVPNPTREGHEFLGWYSDPQLTQVFDSETSVKSDLTLYAYWTWDTKTPKFMMGKYPQKLIRNGTLTKTLDNLTSSKNSEDYYDFEYDGTRYRKAKSRAAVYDTTPGEYYYFKFDYVYWDVAKVSQNSFDNTLRLTSHYVLDNRPFDSSTYKSFSSSTLCGEISDFTYSGLSDVEQAGLLKSMTILPDSYYFKDEPYEATQYAQIMGFDNKIWQEYVKNESNIALDNSTHELIATSANNYCGVVPMIKEFDPSEKNYHTLSFDVSGGHPIDSVKVYYGEKNRSYNLPKAQKDSVFDGDEIVRYEFLGWQNFPGQSSTKPYTKYYSTDWGDITLKAAFKENREVHYSTITYVMPSGAVNKSGNLTSVRPTQEFTLLDPYFEHHDFLGWYLESNYKTKIEVVKNIKNDLRLYAKFVNGTYPITYHLDGDAVNDERNPTSFVYTTEDDIRQIYPAQSQHRTFKGWALNESLTEHLDLDRINLKNQTYIHLYPIWESKKYTFYFSVDEDNGEKFLDSVEYCMNHSDFTWSKKYDTGDLYFTLSYEAKYATYGDIYLPRAAKEHYRFNGYKVNGVLVNKDTPIDFEHLTLVADFTYVEAGVDFVYTLPSGVYFDELAPEIDHFDEGVTGTLNFPIDPVGHRLKAYYCRGESTNKNYFSESTILPVGSDGQVDPITYYVYFELIHESEYDHYSSHCLYCDAEFDASDYSGTFEVGKTIEFGFYPWSGIKKSLPAGIELPTVEDPKGWTLDLTHGGHSKSKYAHFDLHQVEYGRIYKYRFLYLFDKEEVVCWKYMPLKWHVMKADTVNGIYNLQCEYYVDSIIFSAEKEFFVTPDEVNNETYSYKTSFAREYINTDLFNLMFDSNEQEYVVDTTYTAREYLMNFTTISDTVGFSEVLTDKVYLECSKDTSEPKYDYGGSWKANKSYSQIRTSYFNDDDSKLLTRDLCYDFEAGSSKGYYVILRQSGNIPYYWTNPRKNFVACNFIIAPRISVKI